MKRLGMLTLICSFVFTTLQTSNARADAETMGSRCVNQVHATLDRVESRVADRTTATVTLIERYLAVGRVEAATLAARECFQETKEDLRLAANYMTRICDHCVERLRRMKEFRLARRVANTCSSAIDQLAILLDRQKQVLDDALHGD